jgi:diguanylate cyclase (GGDEF)-like protein/PAS domain S-box-containing protein
VALSSGTHRDPTGGSGQAPDGRDGAAPPAADSLAEQVDELARVRAELVRENQRLALVMEGSRLGLWDWNMQTDEAVFDDRWAEIVGYRLEELEPIDIYTWDRLNHPDDLEVSNDLMEQHAQGLIPYYDGEFRMKHRDGRWIWVRERGKVVEWSSDGRPLRMTGTCEDITDRVLARHALADSERQYRLLAENSTDVVCQLDADFVIRWVSPSSESVLGWPPGQLLGRHVRTVVHADDWGAVVVRGMELSARTAGPPLEVRLRTSDGGTRWMSVHTRPTTDDAGSVDGTILGLRDVEQQVLARQALADSELHYRMLSQNATDAVFMTDLAGVVTWVSPAIQQVMGYDPGDLVGKERDSLAHPDDLPMIDAVVERLIEGQVGVPFEVRGRLATGEYRWMSGVANVAYDGEGSVVGLIAAMRDVHDQVLVRQALAEKDRLFRLAMDGAPQGMAVVGLDLRYLQVNEALCAMLGREERWLLAHTIRDVIHPHDQAAETAGRDELLDGRTQRKVSECRWRRADGSPLWVVHSKGLLRDEQHRPLFYVSHVQDDTDAHRIREELARRANHDPLTGLFNRDQLQAHLTHVLTGRATADSTPGLLYCDLDHFKHVNDTYGHDTGDEVLRITADRISSTLRSDDVVARLGGDEFVVLLANVPDQAAAIDVAQKIRSAVAEPLPTIDDGTLTVSVGVALAVGDLDGHRLLRNADAALYEAKNSGRNQIALFSGKAMSDAESSIREGLAEGEFAPWFQPIVTLADEAVVGYEALARWARADGSVLEPDAFLPAAEQADRITEIDRAVLQQCCQRLSDLPGPVHVAVNVSAATISSDSFVEDVVAALTRTGVDPSRLHLEFTETALLSVTAETRDSMRRLADLGVPWYVDDFGTGYSSIAHLRDLPIAGLKLDKSFTAGLGSPDRTCERLAQALAGMADGLGLDTVAEGIETSDQAAILRAQGWKHGQGWLYAHPAPAEPPLAG